MNNKKGFTLIELLAVIVIIAVISLISVPTVRHLINKNKQKAYETKIELILKQAKLYAKEKNLLYTSSKRDGNYVCATLTVQKLYDEGYLEKEDDVSSGKYDITDPRTGNSMMSKTIKVFIKSNEDPTSSTYQEEGIYIGNIYATDESVSSCQ